MSGALGGRRATMTRPWCREPARHATVVAVNVAASLFEGIAGRCVLPHCVTVGARRRAVATRTLGAAGPRLDATLFADPERSCADRTAAKVVPNRTATGRAIHSTRAVHDRRRAVVRASFPKQRIMRSGRFAQIGMSCPRGS
jgi:hypothetical protein